MKKHVRLAAIAAVSATAIAAPALATHAWSSYHWQRTGAVITPPVVTAVNSTWAPRVAEAVADWNGNDPDQIYTDYIESPGPTPASGVNPRTCKAQAGKILVCNARYGYNGWLGIASIWLSGGHISQGTTKLNDTYFDTPTYNSYSWRQLVTCQEIGHDYGLGHQDEDFDTDATKSCMDYTSAPAGNETPDKHDFEQLAIIYSHSHSAFQALGPGQSRSTGLNGAAPGDTPAEWGRAVHYDKQGRPDYFLMDLGNGNKKITHVFWAIGEGPRGGRDH